MDAPTLPILYRDGALVVVDKPAGMIVHRGWAQDEVTALSVLRGMLGQWVSPVHRLDRGPSGGPRLGPAPAGQYDQLLPVPSGQHGAPMCGGRFAGRR